MQEARNVTNKSHLPIVYQSSTNRLPTLYECLHNEWRTERRSRGEGRGESKERREGREEKNQKEKTQVKKGMQFSLRVYKGHINVFVSTHLLSLLIKRVGGCRLFRYTQDDVGVIGVKQSN